MPSTDFVYVADEDGLHRYNKQGSLNQEVTSEEVTAVALDEYENVYAAVGTGSNAKIRKYDSSFNQLWTQTNLSVSVTSIVAVESQNTLYYGTRSQFGDGSVGRIWMEDDGLRTGGAQIDEGDVPSGVTGLSWDARGYVWVSGESDSSNPENIFCLNEDPNNLVQTWTVSTSKASDNNPVTGIRFDNEEEAVFFTDADGMVRKANADPTSTTYPGDLWDVQHTAGSYNFTSSTNLQRDYFAADADGVTRLNQDGSTQWSADVGQEVRDVAVDYNNTAYVLSKNRFGSEKVYKLDTDGTTITSWEVANSANDIAVYQEFDSDPYSWRRNTLNNFINVATDTHIVQLSNSGSVERTVDTDGSRLPQGPQIDPEGVVYSVDTDDYVKAYDNRYNLLWKADLGGTNGDAALQHVAEGELYTLTLTSSGRIYRHAERDGHEIEAAFSPEPNDDLAYPVMSVTEINGTRYLNTSWRKADTAGDTDVSVHRYEIGSNFQNSEEDFLTINNSIEGDVKDIESFENSSQLYLLLTPGSGFGADGEQVKVVNENGNEVRSTSVDNIEDIEIVDDTIYTDESGIAYTNTSYHAELRGNSIEYYDNFGSLRWSTDISQYGSIETRGLKVFPDKEAHPDFWKTLVTNSDLLSVDSVATDSESDIPVSTTTQDINVVADITTTETLHEFETTSTLVAPSTQMLVSETLIQADTTSAENTITVPTTSNEESTNAQTNASVLSPDVFATISDSDNEAVTVTVPNLINVADVGATSLKEQVSKASLQLVTSSIQGTTSEEGITANSTPSTVDSTITFSNSFTQTFEESVDNTVFSQTIAANSNTEALTQGSLDVVSVTFEQVDTANALTDSTTTPVAIQTTGVAFPGTVIPSILTAVSADTTQLSERLDITTTTNLQPVAATSVAATSTSQYETVSTPALVDVDPTISQALRKGLIGIKQVQTTSVPPRVYAAATTTGVNEQRVQTFGDSNRFNASE